MRRRAKGNGSLFKLKSGRWAAEVNMTLANGESERVRVSGKSKEVAREKLNKLLEQEKQKIPYAEKDWTVGDYLDHWLNNIQSRRVRETTMSMYGQMIRIHIKPTLGGIKLRKLTVQDVRNALNTLEDGGHSGAVLQKYHQILSACLNCAMRDELVHRNVASLAEKPQYTPKDTQIWSLEQATTFLQSMKGHPQYVIFLILLTYGVRRGEALGLRYSDIDFVNGQIHIRQQIDRIGGKIIARDLKTKNSQRSLPLVSSVYNAIIEHANKNGVVMPPFNPKLEISTEGTIVKSTKGTALEPSNLRRTFDLFTEKAGLPRIKIHAMRHTAATIFKDLNIPIKDAQLILGHANASTTLNIYQHGNPETHRIALNAVEEHLSDMGVRKDYMEMEADSKDDDKDLHPAIFRSKTLVHSFNN